MLTIPRAGSIFSVFMNTHAMFDARILKVIIDEKWLKNNWKNNENM